MFKMNNRFLPFSRRGTKGTKDETFEKPFPVLRTTPNEAQLELFEIYQEEVKKKVIHLNTLEAKEQNEGQAGSVAGRS